MSRYNFRAEQVRDNTVAWIKELSKTESFTKVVIGISGGKDSAVAAALCCRALGSENVTGLLLPDNIQPDLDDSIEVCKSLNMKYETINIHPIVEAIRLQYTMFVQHGVGITPEADINIMPRARLIMLRLWGQSNHARVCGTSNLSETMVGYCTKDGDTRSDFNPLGALTSIEVVKLGETLEELPQHIVHKEPADGLSGVSDETKLGLKYIDIHKYIRNIVLEPETWSKINDLKHKSKHKNNIPIRYLQAEEVYSSGN